MKVVPEFIIPGKTNIVTIYGSSTEEKPIQGVSNGSVFIETDTLKVYMLDKPNRIWREISCCQTDESQQEG